MPNRYIKYTDKLEFKTGGFISKFFSKILPKPTPYFDDLYEQVHTWFLEIDDEHGVAVREIGFSKTGTPIVFGPFKSNRGVWIDAPIIFDPENFETITSVEFQEYWSELESQFN